VCAAQAFIVYVAFVGCLGCPQRFNGAKRRRAPNVTHTHDVEAPVRHTMQISVYCTTAITCMRATAWTSLHIIAREQRCEFNGIRQMRIIPITLGIIHFSMPRAQDNGTRIRFNIGSVAGKVAKHNTTSWRVPMFIEKRATFVETYNHVFDMNSHSGVAERLPEHNCTFWRPFVFV